MSKLSRRDFLKRIGIMSFMTVPSIEMLGAEEVPGPELVEVFVENKGWDVARSIGYAKANSDGSGWTFVDDDEWTSEIFADYPE